MTEKPFGRTVYIDTETTGLDENTHRIMEVALVVVEPSLDGRGEASHEVHFAVDVDGQLSPGAVSVLGNRTTSPATRGPISTIADRLHRYLHGATWVGHNVGFDRRFLDAEYARLGQPAPLPAALVDTAEICRSTYPDLATHGLVSACERAGVEGPRSLEPSESTRAVRRLLHALDSQRERESPHLS